MKNFYQTIFIFIIFIFTCNVALSDSKKSQTSLDGNGFFHILSLQEKQDDKIINRIDFFANQLDPNVQSIDDQYYIEINGARIDIADDLLSELNHKRRSYSYDSLSEGIISKSAKHLCAMAGPAKGRVLYARYLTYDNNYKLAESKIQPVYSEKINCLFAESYAPKSRNSFIEAAQTAAILSTIGHMAK